MPHSRHYDTVSFDVRENAAMLFFAKTTEPGDIDDYMLLVRTIEEDFDEALYIEVNERQFGGHDLLSAAELVGNVLTLRLRQPAAQLDGSSEIVLTYEETPENLANIEAGVFRVLGDALASGNA